MGGYVYRPKHSYTYPPKRVVKPGKHRSTDRNGGWAAISAFVILASPIVAALMGAFQ